MINLLFTLNKLLYEKTKEYNKNISINIIDNFNNILFISSNQYNEKEK